MKAMKHLIVIIVLFAAIFMSCEEKESVSPLIGQWKTTNLANHADNDLQKLRYVMNISAVENDSIIIESFQHRTSTGLSRSTESFKKEYRIQKSQIQRSNDERFYDLVYIEAEQKDGNEVFKFTGKIDNGELQAIKNKKHYLTRILGQKRAKFRFWKN